MMLQRTEKSLLPIFIVLAVIILSPLLRQVWVAVAYDDRPPVVLHTVTIHTPQIEVGGTVRWTTVYSKRADCSPPHGRGEVTYRVLGSPKHDATRHNIYDLDLKREARWRPGDHLSFASSLQIPDDIPPGHYTVLNMASYTCKGASRTLHVEPAPMPLEIVAR